MPEAGRDLLTQIADHARDAMVVAFPDAGIVYYNRAFADLLGISGESVVGQSLGVLRASETDPSSFDRLVAAAARGAPIDLDMAVRSARGPRWAGVAGRPLKGDASPYLIRLREIAEERTAGEMLPCILAGLTSEAVYRLDVRPDCRLVLDRAGGAFTRLTGYAADEIEALGGWPALVEPADLHVVQRRGQRLLAGEPTTATYRIRTRSGSLCWLHEVARPLRDDDRDLVVAAWCVARDVGDRRALEAELDARRADAGVLAGLASGLVVRFTPDGWIDDVVGDARGELGTGLRAAAGRTLDDALGLETAATWRAGVDRVVQEGSPARFEFTHATASGEETYRVALAPAAGGRLLAVLRFLGTSGTSDEARPSDSFALAGATTDDERRRLGSIIDHIADGVIVLNDAATIVGFSRSAEAIFGYQREEIVGRGVDVLLARGGPGAAGAPGDLLAEVTPPGDRLEAWGRRKGGEIIPVELAIGRLDHDGDPPYVLTVRDITIRKQTEETIRNLAYLDALTGLPNRLLFNDRVGQAIERARRNHQVLAVLLLDLDRFMLINESLGLESGDGVLRAVGQRLVAALRRSDTVARLGSDDFLVLLPAIGGAENAAKVAQKLLDALATPFRVDDHDLHVAASIGIALYPHDGDAPEELIRNADTALYRAKERSRGGYQFYTTDMNAAAFERLILETQLRRALERDELMLCYQPQVRLDTGEIVGVEALVRWRHPDLGLVAPGEFIPLAEETGLILAIGRWVLETACTQMRAWQEEGFTGLRLAVNLSARQFRDADLVDGIAEALEASGLDPRALELELTESVIMHEADAVVSKMQALDRLGIRLTIDDFGTGYSSLGYLKRFPIRALKIDQSFVQDITADANAAAIAQAIVALGESLKLRVIAEGVETPQQLGLLRHYHCAEMQGFLFSKPLPPDELIDLLRRGARLVG